MVNKLPEVVFKDTGTVEPEEILLYILANYGSQYISPQKLSFEFVAKEDKETTLLQEESLISAINEIFRNVNVLYKKSLIAPYHRYTYEEGIRNLGFKKRKWYSLYGCGEEHAFCLIWKNTNELI